VSAGRFLIVPPGRQDQAPTAMTGSPQVNWFLGKRPLPPVFVIRQQFQPVQAGGMSQTRLKFERADVRPHGEDQVHVELTFAFRKRLIVVSAIDDKEWPGSLRAASAATLTAIKQAGAEFECEIEELDRVNALGKELIAVLIKIDFEGRQLQVFGSCQITESELVSAVRATLNATNRFVDLATRE
jgi:hypothetical protein